MFKNIIKLIKILDAKQKKSFKYLICLMLIAMILETVGIASLVPLINLFSDGNLLSNFNIEIYLKSLGIDIKSNINIFIILILFFFILKNTFLVFFYYLDSKFIYKVRFDLGVSLFKKYLYNDYLFHVRNNSAKLKEKIIGQTSIYGGALSGLSQIICEGLIIFGLLLFLFLIKPLETLIILLTGLFLSSFFYLIMRNRIYILGKKRIFFNTALIKTMTEGFDAIKDIMIFRSQKEFINNLREDSKNLAKAAYTMIFISRLPKIWFEMSLIVVLTVLILIIGEKEENYGSIIATVGIFLITALRILPASNKILQGLQTIKFSESTLDSLEEDLKEEDLKLLKDSSKKNEIFFKNKIEFKRVNFNYDGSKSNILKDINFKINKNEFIGIIGETGSGKSTLIDLLTGLIKPISGSIEVDGNSISKNPNSWIEKIGYVPQNVYLTDETIEKNISFGYDKDSSNEEMEKAIRNAQLTKFIASLKNGIKTKVGERAVKISGGERQRIGIARALYRNPDILLFDEATSALDIETENSFFNTLNSLKKKKTIIFITHRKNNLDFFDQVFLIKNNSLINQIK
ncbi:ABC transporter ATP-binding protein/permease [Pelagibacteraceae bacterium]|nr:ABC transporter ATP-binding protein/permease [Pelagibacteraceae bacterium]